MFYVFFYLIEIKSRIRVVISMIFMKFRETQMREQWKVHLDNIVLRIVYDKIILFIEYANINAFDASAYDFYAQANIYTIPSEM